MFKSKDIFFWIMKENIIDDKKAEEKRNNANVINCSDNSDVIIIFIHKLLGNVLPENIHPMLKQSAFVEQKIKPCSKEYPEKDKFKMFSFGGNAINFLKKKIE